MQEKIKDDTISRQAAIDEICLAWCSRKYDDCVHISDFKLGCYFCDGCSDVQAIMDLLPAQSDIIRCNACKHWTQTTGNMPGFGLGDCDYLNAKLVNCNGYCYWAERREENDQYTGNKLAEGLRAKPG